MLSMAMGLAACIAMNGPYQSSSAAKQPGDGSKGGRVTYRTMDTATFKISVPSGWSVSKETPWGAREITPGGKESDVSIGSMSTMTGPGLGRQGWDQLYKTSLYFITRDGRDKTAKATEYRLGRNPQGFETCSWEMTGPNGDVRARYVILKHDNGNILALSVKLPTGDDAKARDRTDRMFRHMVDTAVVK